MKVKGLTIHGPDRTSAFLHATRHFIMRPDMGMKAIDISITNDASFEEDGLVFKPILFRNNNTFASSTIPLVLPSSSSSLPSLTSSSSLTSLVDTSDDLAKTRLHARSDSIDDKTESLSSLKRHKASTSNVTKPATGDHIHSQQCQHTHIGGEDDTKRTSSSSSRDGQPIVMDAPLSLDEDRVSYAVAYLVHGPVVPGKFDSERARALGLLPGPAYGALSKGKTVQVMQHIFVIYNGN
jgi:hypothetical protein